MSNAPLMVGVSGLRGIVGESLTPEVAVRYAGSFASWLRERCTIKGKLKVEPTVVVARDGRLGGEAIRDAVVAGVAGSGCRVYDVGVAMTPTLAVLVDDTDAQAGIQITASHNPQQWNGIKILLPDKAWPSGGACSAAAPPARMAEEIVARFRSREPRWAPWDAVQPVVPYGQSLESAHTEAVRLALRAYRMERGIRAAKVRVALDCVGGAGGVLSPKVLRSELRCRVDLSGGYLFGKFTHEPEPTRENLAGFAKQVRRKRAEVGFAQDPDADRLAIVDERGEYIGEEYTLALAAESLLSARADVGRAARSGRRRGAPVLVTNLSTSRMLDDVAAKYGARVVRTPVGEANVVEAMKREKAAGREVVLGGEGNGGVIWPRVTYVRDSLSAMALVLALMARTGKKVSELVAGMPAYAIEKRKVDLARKEDALPAIEKLASAYGGERVDLQDGVRIDWVNGARAGRAWLHVRASNTEPIMRLIAEAPTGAEAAAILDEASGRIG